MNCRASSPDTDGATCPRHSGPPRAAVAALHLDDVRLAVTTPGGGDPAGPRGTGGGPPLRGVRGGRVPSGYGISRASSAGTLDTAWPRQS